VKAMGGENYATWPTKMLVDAHMDFVIVRRRTNLQSEEGAYVSHMNIEDTHHLECLGVKPRRAAVGATWMWCRAMNETREDSKDDKYKADDVPTTVDGQTASGAAAGWKLKAETVVCR
jgi:hypothetical protein